MSLSSSTRTPAPNARQGRPAGGGTNRLPNSRERRPALAALAVILILLGAAGSALIAINSGDRVAYVAVKKQLPPGHRIVPEDLASGDLAGATGALIKWSDRDRIINKYTTGWLYKDQYFSDGNVTDQMPIPSNGAQVGVVLDAGRAPADGIETGDIVSVVRIPSANQDSVAASAIVSAAVVTSAQGGVVADKTSTVNTLNVTILVPVGKASTVAAAAASKTLVLVKLSPGTKPDVPLTAGTN